MEVSRQDLEYTFPGANGHYEEHEDILTAMMDSLTLIPVVPRPLRSCLRSSTLPLASSPNGSSQSKSVLFDSLATIHYYSTETPSLAKLDLPYPIHSIDYIGSNTTAHAAIRPQRRARLIENGGTMTCVQPIFITNEGLPPVHVSAQTRLSEARRRLNWIQYKAIGRVSNPPSIKMKQRINDAARLLSSNLDMWVTHGEIRGARAESCMSVHNKRTLDELVKIFEEYVEAEDESVEARVKWDRDMGSCLRRIVFHGNCGLMGDEEESEGDRRLVRELRMRE